MNTPDPTPKVLANRRNAQQSTGPHDTTLTCQNARKHGLLSAGLTELDDPAHYRDLLASLTAELQPVGILETFLVERITLGMVRVRRASRLEAEHVNGSRNDPDSFDPMLSRPAPALSALTIAELADGFVRYEGAHQNLFLKALRELRELQRERKATHRAPPAAAVVEQDKVDT